MRSLFVRHIVVPAALKYRGRPYLRLAERMSRDQYEVCSTRGRKQLAAFRALLTHAMDHVPYYKERFRAERIRPEAIREHAELGSVPVLDKEDVLSNFPDRMTAADADEGVAGSDWHYVGTRGTTERVMVVHDGVKRDDEWAASYLAMTEDSEYQLGKRLVLIPPDECSKVCGVGAYRPRSVLEHAAAMMRNGGGGLRSADRWSELRALVMETWLRRVTVLPPFGADGTHIGDEDLASYCRHLARLEPTLLKALPEYLVAIARFADRSGHPLPRVPVIKPMGSKLSPTLVPTIERVFGGSVREDYGSQELGAMGFDCRFRAGLHLMESSFLLEVTRGGVPVPDGEVGSIVVTDLSNRAMPLIRYRIGDVGRLEREVCRCGRTSARLHVEGRLEDSLVVPTGRVVTPEVLGALYGLAGLEDFKLVEEGNGRWQLNYVASESMDETALRRRLRAELDLDSSSGDERLRLRKVRSILPEPSGKFRHCVSRSYGALETSVEQPVSRAEA